MIGKRILHYDITEKLGEGGMGEVYLADDTRLDRQVALKFLNRTFREDTQAHDRLVREARSASQLGHTNIVSIHAIEETDEHLFIVMEYVKGRSLRDVVRTGEITPDLALDYGNQILEALAAAHDKGIVHRDIKSDNIKLTPEGQIKVLDFGLARSIDTAEISRTGSSAGTPAYMAPEQVQGESADHRSDLFSFGVVFYEMLTTRRPFRGEHESAVTYSIVNEDPDPLNSHERALPAGLQPIMDRLLAKDPEHRYQDANDVLTDLNRVRSGEKPQVAKPRRPLIPLLLAILAIVVVFAGAFYFMGRGDEAPQPRTTPGGRIKLVVLPFENLGPTDQEYFADGVTEEVITRLAKLSGLGVISRTSAMKYKDTDKTLREIGDELDVDYALEGTIRWDRTGDTDRVRINTQLIRVSDDVHLWAEGYDRVFEQIFALETEIAEKVAEALNVTLLEPERVALKKAPTDNMEAYDFYLKGREMYDRSGDRDHYELATRLLEKSVQLDSTFALAHALLARYYTNDHFNNRFPDQPRLQQGRQAALAALRHSPDGPEGHVAMGYYYYYGSRDYSHALDEFEVAKRREPNNTDVLQAMGYVQRRQGNWDESYRNLRRAFELDPTSSDLVGAVIETALHMRLFREADLYIEKGLAFAPDFPPFHMYKALRLMLHPGDLDAAIAIMAEVEKNYGGTIAAGYQMNLELLAGQFDKVLGRLTSLEASSKLFAEGDSANYYLIKGLTYDLKTGLETQSELATTYYDSARVVLEHQLGSRSDDPQVHSALGLAWAGLRNREQAYLHSDRAVELMPLSKDALAGADMLQNKAGVRALFGDADEAIDILEHLLNIPAMLTPASIDMQPFFIPLHSHPRYKRLIQDKKTL
jgi:serine/threonine protein kinase/tetratricopeptide (TPR) repeat protein